MKRCPIKNKEWSTEMCENVDQTSGKVAGRSQVNGACMSPLCEMSRTDKYSMTTDSK